jgi:hypothetical protein
MPLDKDRLAHQPPAACGSDARKAVNLILAEFLAGLGMSLPDRVRIGNDLCGQILAALSSAPVAPVCETLAEAEARVMQDYQWGNLTRLGVANHLRRAGFKLEVATDKANALPVAPVGEVLRAMTVDDPSWICSGIPDTVIEAGVDAWSRANNEIVEREATLRPEELRDWDEGMIVSAIFKNMLRTALQNDGGEG